jgi:hypothetical protein
MMRDTIENLKLLKYLEGVQEVQNTSGELSLKLFRDSKSPKKSADNPSTMVSRVDLSARNMPPGTWIALRSVG